MLARPSVPPSQLPLEWPSVPPSQLPLDVGAAGLQESRAAFSYFSAVVNHYNLVCELAIGVVFSRYNDASASESNPTKHTEHAKASAIVKTNSGFVKQHHTTRSQK